MKAAKIFAVSVALAIPLALIRAWVLGRLWSWFVVPLGAPSLSLAHLYGLGVLLGYVTYQHMDSDSDKDPILRTVSLALSMVLFSLVVLASGWVALQLAGDLR